MYKKLPANHALQDKLVSHPIVTIYDSIFDTVDANTSNILKQLFGPKVQVVVNNDRKQVGTEDCGLFALANSVCLAEGGLPGNYDQSKMREHLVDCINNTSFTLFPCVLHA